MGRRALRLRGAVEAAPVGRSGTSRHELDDAWLSTLRSHGGLVPALPSPVLEPSGSRSPRCCQPPGSPPTRLPPPHPRPDHLRRAHPSAGVRLRLRRIADTSCSATTLRRRRDEWISAGVAEQLRRAVLAAHDRLFGLELEHLVVDSCITKAPCGGQVAGPSPVDRRKRGLKRSMVTEAGGVPLATLPAQPITRRRAAGGDAGHHRRGRRATRTASGAPGRRLRLEALPTGSWPKAGWSARSPH
jgi:hypothetical protein